MVHNTDLFRQHKKQKLTLQSTFLLLLLLGLNYIFSFAWQAYLTRVLGQEVYGAVFFSDKLLLAFAYIFDLGYFLLGAASLQEDSLQQRQTFSAIISLKLITAFVGIILLVLLERLVLNAASPNYSYLVYIFFVALLLEKLLPDFVYRAKHRMPYLLVCNLFSRIILFALLLVFVKTANDYIWIPSVYALAAALLLVLVFFDLSKDKQLKLVFVNLRTLKLTFTKSLSLAGSKLANCCFNCLTVLALHYAQKEAKLLSYFLLLDLLFITGRKVLNMLGESFYLHLHNNADYKWYGKVACCLAFLMLVALALLYWQAEWFLGCLFGTEFAQAYPYLRLFLLAAVPACISALLAYPLLAAKGELKLTNLAFFIGVFFYAIALLYLCLTDNLQITAIIKVYTLSVYVECGVNCWAVLSYNSFQRK